MYPQLRALLFILLAFGSTAAGAAPPLPRGPEIRVSTLENVAHDNPQVAVFPDGGFVIVWTVGPPDGQGRYVIHARFFAPDGTPTSGQFRLIDRGAGSQFANQVVADRDGSFLLAWTETKSLADFKRNVFVRRFNRDGTPRGPRIQANAPHKSSRYRAVLAVGADGRFAVAWTADVDLQPEYRSYTNSVARIFNAQGAPLTKEFKVGIGYPGIGDDNTYSRPAALALAPDRSLIVQRQDFSAPDIYENVLARFDSKGRAKTSSALSDPLFCCVDAPGASLAMGQDGRLAVAWSEWDLMAQRFTAGGEPRGRKFPVGKVPTDENRQEDPQVAVVSGGTFVILWEETDRDGDGGGIFGRVFSADGQPLTDDLQIPTTSAGWQYQPDIASLPQGPVVAVWNHYGSGIFARLLTPD